MWGNVRRRAWKPRHLLVPRSETVSLRRYGGVLPDTGLHEGLEDPHPVWHLSAGFPAKPCS